MQSREKKGNRCKHSLLTSTSSRRMSVVLPKGNSFALELGRSRCPLVEPKKGASAMNGRTLAHVQRARLVRGNTPTTNVASIKERAKANPKANPKAKHATSPKVVDKNNKRNNHDSGNRAVTTHQQSAKPFKRHIANVAFQKTQSKSASSTLRANVPSHMTNALWYTIRLAGTSRVRANVEKETNASFRIVAKKVFW